MPGTRPLACASPAPTPVRTAASRLAVSPRRRPDHSSGLPCRFLRLSGIPPVLPARAPAALEALGRPRPGAFSPVEAAPPIFHRRALASGPASSFRAAAS